MQPSMMTRAQSENENPNQAKNYRDRINSYAAKKKKFGDTGKFLFRQEQRPLNWEEQQDMKIKGK